MDACERTGSFAGILCLCSAYFTHMFLYGCIYVYIYEHVCTYMLSGMVVYGSRMQCSAVIWAALLLHCMVFYRHVELYHAPPNSMPNLIGVELPFRNRGAMVIRSLWLSDTMLAILQF